MGVLSVHHAGSGDGLDLRLSRVIAAQSAFKKNGFLNAMRKAKRAATRRGRRLRILFADEARFGRINRPRPCWAPIGIRPEVASQLIREYIYLA